jgi:TetR/AcrR family transcriptional regulator
MDEIDRKHLDRWTEITRAYLLSGPDTPAQRIALPVTRELEPQGNLDCRHGRDRFLSRVRQQLFSLMRETGLYGEDGLRELERTFYSHVSFIARHPEIPRRILTWCLQGDDARLRRRVQKVVTHYEYRVVRLITKGQKQGCIRPDLEPRAATGLFVGMLQNLVLRLPADRFQPEVLLRDANRLFSAYAELVRAGGGVRGIACGPGLNPSAV